jgi:hypothetical protein
MIAMADIDFLIIGATKSATTWLQRSLTMDEAVLMPEPHDANAGQTEDALELHYFSRDYHRGDDWYLGHFHPGPATCVRGEKSNSYLESPEAAERIAARLPQVRLIAQLRNPIDRAYSDYCMLLRRGEVSRDIAQQLDPRRQATSRILEGGLYGRQLKAYYDRFPAERILVTDFDRVAADPVGLLAEVRQFLGLDPATAAGFVKPKVKSRETPVLSPGLRRALKPLKQWVAPLRSTPAFRSVHALLAQKTDYPALPGAIRARLNDYYQADIASLGQLLGRDFSGWIRPPVGETVAD